MTQEVENLLKEKEIQYVGSGHDFLVKCFNPEHEDTHPSMRISQEDGAFHCFGCGYKGNIFTRFNKFRNVFNSKVQNLRKDITELRRASWTGYEIPVDAVMLYEPYRDISAEIIRDFSAFTTSEMGMEDRIVLPIRDVTEIIVGFQGRHKYSDSSPKYLMYPAGVSLPWYPSPSRIKPIGNSILLVEGLIDALYLQSKGLTNAVSVFGTKSITFDTVEDLVNPYLLIGVDKIFIMMDGDNAGRSASKAIEKILKHKTDAVIQEIELGDGEDPATVSDAYLNMIKTYMTTEDKE